MKAYLLIICLFVAHGILAQSSFIPQGVGAGVNSTYDEINPVLSPDGKALYFTRVNHPENTYGAVNTEDIWVSRLNADGTWAPAVRVNNLNIGRYNNALSISADGNSMLLQGIYNRKGNIWKKRGLSLSTKNGEEWSTPVRLRMKKLSKRNRGMKSSASMSADGTYIVLSMSRSYNSDKTNLFLSYKKGNGKWKRPIPIRELNTRYNEEAPFLSADGNTLYFSSDRKHRGQFDIFTSKRSAKDKYVWEDAVPLSDTINTPQWDSYFKTTGNGSWAYFASTRTGTTGGADIYKVKLFEENPFVIVSGTFRNAKTGNALTGKTVTLNVNGQPFTDAVINADSGTYKAKLPLRKTYTLVPQAEHYTGVAETVDVSTVREFTKTSKDLKLTPYPYVRVQGKLIVQGTGKIIPASATPKVVVNGVVSDSAHLNTEDGTYYLLLKHGAKYALQATAKRYEPVVKAVDATDASEYREIALDLEVTAEKMVHVMGTVIDKKTGKAVAASAQASIAVEGMPEVAATMNPENGTYELSLPPRRRYTVSARASGYYPVYEELDFTNEAGNTEVPRDLLIVPIEVGQSIRMNNIFFEVAKSVLKKESFAELDRVSKFLNDNPDIKIEIGGHTDNVGKAATNQKLSQARAKAVADYIIKQGVAKDRVVAKGYGMTKPVASNATKDGKAMNRRVEFTILDK